MLTGFSTIMRHDLSRMTERRPDCSRWGLLVPAALLFSLMAQSAIAATDTAQEEPPKPRFTKPLEGPEFESPIDEEQRLDSSETSSPDSGADRAYGAYQRGFFLTALSLALPRAETGDPAAQTLIAELYWSGQGVARDRKKAMEWYRFGAEGGNREAQFALGNALLQGQIVKLDKQEGRKFLEKAAKAGHVRAAFNLAQLITAARPTWAGFKEALPWYEQAAEGGLADAQYAMANIHADAKGINFGDDKKAFEWLRKAAGGGFDTAQLELGVWLANGRGTAKNPQQAYRWMQRAAAQRNVIAQNRLARMYAYGVGTTRDIIRAGAWHIISRRAGFSDSEMDRFFQGLSAIDKKRAIEAANQLDRRIAS